MPPPNDTPTALLHTLATTDPTRPRLTWYDDQPGPTQGERIELSGRVLATWAAKAANLLQDELDAGPGSLVAVDLGMHWRAAYWLFAAWSVGAQVMVGRGAADVLVTADPGRPAAAGRVVAASEAALARGWPGEPLAAGVVDEARDLPSYGDVYVASDAPRADDPAFDTGVGRYTYEQVMAAARAAADAAGLADGARVMTSAHAHQAVEAWLPAWVVNGSLVLVRGNESAAGESRLGQIAAAERVTARL